jgi:hypothetical protein
MASAHIEVSSSARLGGQVRSLVDSLQANTFTVTRLKAVFDQTALGGDFDALGAALGLTGLSAATDAEAIYNLLGSVQGELANDAFTAQFLSRLG